MLVVDTSTQQDWQRAAKAETNAAARQKALDEEIKSNITAVNIDDAEDSASLIARMGTPLLAEEVQRRLKLCNPNLIFERSITDPSYIGLLFEKDERTPAGGWEKRKIHLFTFASTSIMPEKEVAHVRMKKVPNPDFIAATDGQKVDRDIVRWIEVPTLVDLTRGWRTVVLRLLKAELITLGDVEKHFPRTPNSKNWQEQTR
jgi:hypothetical protein